MADYQYWLEYRDSLKRRIQSAHQTKLIWPIHTPDTTAVKLAWLEQSLASVERHVERLEHRPVLIAV
jgi:hypothetical protein